MSVMNFITMNNPITLERLLEMGSPAKNDLGSVLIAAGVLVATFIACYIFAKVLRKMTFQAGNMTRSKLVSAAAKTDQKLCLLILFIPIYVASKFVALPTIAVSAISHIGVIVITVVVASYIARVLIEIVNVLLVSSEDVDDDNIRSLVSTVIKVVVWVFALLVMLNNLGVNITTLIAGLGIGGMAIALASQSLVADLFNYVTISLDKPFKINDYVTVAGFSGKVKSIGLKGTRLISDTGEEIVVNNSGMTSNILKNYDIMTARRVSSTVTFTKNATVDNIDDLRSKIEGIVSKIDGVQFKRAHCTAFADNALVYLVAYNINGDEYYNFLNKKEEVSIALLKGLKEHAPTVTNA